ncbi:MAG: sirohydrochlorin chelatase [Alphaproteobacteria bacterium]|nr:sirohydrochlorin chelatase [Alphaproteobacteria bacterium]MCY4231489.1 sirohydrochlorin chelatase [Alphaproteobacteria bacterium]MCY4318893.1 sirohydrochlorin chelatase [Alphaproteobacteria bacterium]
MPKTGVMVCGHGSRDTDAVREFLALAEGLRPRLPDYDLEIGFLEFARPVIREGLEALAARGNRRILAVPGMLFAAGHVKNDVPSEINEFAQTHPEIDIRLGRDLAIDAKLLQAARDRIESALDDDMPRAETLLMVVGRGTNDPDANSNVSKVARMLWEGMGFGWAETCYSGVAHPRVDAGLERAARLGFRRIVVFPYFLFTGVLIRRIYDLTDKVAAAHPGTTFVKAPYLNDHPLVLDSFAERVRGVLTGDNLMNCALCKYREQIVGREDEVGTPQAGHHHHVRGGGHSHGHDHGHGHSHDH